MTTATALSTTIEDLIAALQADRGCGRREAMIVLARMHPQHAAAIAGETAGVVVGDLAREFGAELTNTAIHEAGHSVVADAFDCGGWVVTLSPSGRFSGIFMPAVRSNMGAREYKEELIIRAAGAPAVERAGFYDELGDSEDRKQMTELAWRLVGFRSSTGAHRAAMTTADNRARVMVNRCWRDIEYRALLFLMNEQHRLQITRWSLPLERLDALAAADVAAATLDTSSEGDTDEPDRDDEVAASAA